MLHSISVQRTIIRLTGKDRAKFLHNFCTADIVGMQSGQVREAMILDTKGKLLGLVHVFCTDDSLEINTVPDQADALMQHLDRYIIREDVQLSDASANFQHQFVFPAPASSDSAKGEQWFRELPDCPPVNSWNEKAPENSSIKLAIADFAGPSILIQFPSGSSAQTDEMFAANKTQPADSNLLTLHRILARCPWFGIDCDNSNLPQELQRDDIAISFTKGCYLGQETVARIDSLGQVNRLLVAVRSDTPGKQPPTGTGLLFDEKSVGHLASIATDSDGHWLALAIVRRPSAKPNTILNSEFGSVTVLPASGTPEAA